MFSTSNSSKVMAACVVVMMMAMVAEAAAVPKGDHSKHSAKTHRKSTDVAAVETIPLQINHKAFVSTGTVRPLENTSISPWTYNVTHDDSVFPPMLSEARCLLSGCLDSEGQEDLSLESRPIMHQVQLLRRLRSTGPRDSYHYHLETRLIAVGCTCVRPMVQTQL